MEQDNITDSESFKRMQSLVNKEYYKNNSEKIHERATTYYENNKEAVSIKNKEKYHEANKKKIQERYNKAKDKYLNSLVCCSVCGKEKQMSMLLCDECIIKKFGYSVVF